MRVLDSILSRTGRKRGEAARTLLEVERLEAREVLTATPTLAAGILTVNGGPGNDIIEVVRDLTTDALIVKDAGQEVARFSSPTVASLVLNGNGGGDTLFVGEDVVQDATLNAGDGIQRFQTRGSRLIYEGDGKATLNGGNGNDLLVGSFNNDTLNGDGGNNVLSAGGGANVYTGGPGRNIVAGVIGLDTFTDPTPLDLNLQAPPARNLLNDPFLGLPPSDDQTLLTQSDVNLLLQRATAATPSNDGIIVITDRGGRILGVRIEDGVQAYLNTLPAGTQPGQSDFQKVFDVDGALAEARIAAFFGNNQAPLTSRTFQTTSETTLSQREIESIPSVTDPASTLRGPGFVGPLGLNDHFPRGVADTPQVDQFAIEHTNRDSLFAVGPDNIKGANNGNAVGDDVQLQQRFNVNPGFIPTRILTPGSTDDPFGRSEVLAPPELSGVALSNGAGVGILPFAQSRGLGTLPGGIPIYKRSAAGKLTQVGGIGVFFPGKTGFADEENSSLDSNYDPTKPDRSLEAEYVAFAALGGSTGAGVSFKGALGNAPAIPTGPGGAPLFDLPFGRIDLVGLTLDVFGPKGLNGPSILQNLGNQLGQGTVNGALQPLVNPGADNLINGVGDTNEADGLLNGTAVPEGFLVTPHASADGLVSAADVQKILFQGVQSALVTRAAIRLPMDSNAVQVYTVTSKTGEILGQFRMPDSTIFSIDVSTAKARNVAYYADPTALQPADQVPGVPAGVAFTARTFRYLALPRFPEGIDGAPPGPFSQLNDDPGIDRTTNVNRKPVQPQDLYYDVTGTALQNGPRQPAAVFQSVLGFNAFNPGTNFHDMRTNGVTNPADPAVFQNNLLNRDGIVFFPGSLPLYKGNVEIGGVGASGDGVDQDDITTSGAAAGFDVPDNLRADQYFFGGARLPYLKFNRQPNINPVGSAQLGNPLLART